MRTHAGLKRVYSRLQPSRDLKQGAATRRQRGARGSGAGVYRRQRGEAARGGSGDREGDGAHGRARGTVAVADAAAVDSAALTAE